MSTGPKLKKRLDILLVERGLVTGRDKAKGIIMAGDVYVDNQKADKPGLEVPEDCALEVRGQSLRYVSRGGLKLEKALEVFSIRLRDKVCVDIGASTGGFTDCMLQNGAARVYAVDVGYGQLAWKLRIDDRVVVMERTNIRHVTADALPERADFIGVDVSFISLSLVLPVAYLLLKGGGEAVCLVKPQFEAGREKVGKKGVIRDAAVHREVADKVVRAAEGIGFSPLAFGYSPIRGPEGNIEYLLHLKKDKEVLGGVSSGDIEQVVRQSHGDLEGAP